MAQEGIEFRTNVEVGKDISSNDLFVSYDSILLATGATWPRDLNIPSNFTISKVEIIFKYSNIFFPIRPSFERNLFRNELSPRLARTAKRVSKRTK